LEFLLGSLAIEELRLHLDVPDVLVVLLRASSMCWMLSLLLELIGNVSATTQPLCRP